ncbi:MAG: hypothetical protein N4A33_11715 [Bacteriovoracaceae bacterium]|jgi:hypothetical protein|nr:hypothetical protein [Bacteriovoracaceae bacterium]
MKGLLLIAFAFNAFATDTQTQSTKWNFQNDPYRIDKNFENRLDLLPKSGDISSSGLGWPGYFWANKKGGIAQRWSSEKPQHFKYESPSLIQLRSMSHQKISELSAAEKFDIMMGRYDYPTVKRVWGQTSKRAKAWHGICHGVSPAGLHHIEPKARTLINPHGIKVTFHSSDLKALVAYYYAKISDTGIIQIGKRCFAGKRNPFKAKGCKDVNAASMHIIMANRLGLTKTGYIADIDPNKEVWNHVAVKFNSKILGIVSPIASSAAGTYKRAKVYTEVYYTGGVDPSPFAILGTQNAKWDIKKYEYYLDLDINNKILGGTWISKARPDFIWVKDKETFAHDYYGKILDLL